jgi:3-oxoadipate enol-lactonase
MKVKIAGGELSYDVQGDGPALLLVHGFPLHMGMWDAQVPVFAAAHQVVRFDVRGFGASPPTDGILTMERVADDAAALLDHLGIGRAVLCGLSMGGYAAFAFVRRHAERLRGLVLTNTRAAADDAEARRRRAELAEDVRRRGTVAAVEAFLPKLLGDTTRRERPELVERVRAMAMAAPPQGVVDVLAGLGARADSRPTLREIHVPTLVISGEEDAISPPDEARAMHAAIPKSRVVVVPRAGHVSNLENPEAWNAAVREFLSGLD